MRGYFWIIYYILVLLFQQKCVYTQNWICLWNQIHYWNWFQIWVGSNRKWIGIGITILKCQKMPKINSGTGSGGGIITPLFNKHPIPADNPSRWLGLNSWSSTVQRRGIFYLGIKTTAEEDPLNDKPANSSKNKTESRESRDGSSSDDIICLDLEWWIMWISLENARGMKMKISC